MSVCDAVFVAVVWRQACSSLDEAIDLESSGRFDSISLQLHTALMTRRPNHLGCESVSLSISVQVANTILPFLLLLTYVVVRYSNWCSVWICSDNNDFWPIWYAGSCTLTFYRSNSKVKVICHSWRRQDEKCSVFGYECYRIKYLMDACYMFFVLKWSVRPRVTAFTLLLSRKADAHFTVVYHGRADNFSCISTLYWTLATVGATGRMCSSWPCIKISSVKVSFTSPQLNWTELAIPCTAGPLILLKSTEVASSLRWSEHVEQSCMQGPWIVQFSSNEACERTFRHVTAIDRSDLQCDCICLCTNKLQWFDVQHKSQSILVHV